MASPRAVAAALLLVALAVAGCASGRGAPEPAATAVAPQRGITSPAWGPDEYDVAPARRFLREIRATGADWVVLVPTCYQHDAASEVVRCHTGQTVTDAGLRGAVRRAHALGLKVMIKPHVDLPSDRLDRATISPADRGRWFASYRRMMTRYADLAESSGAEQFCVGTELAGLSGDEARWRGLIAHLRTRYRGPMTYAANYDEFERVPFWDALDLIGIDAYWPLSDTPGDDPERLADAWSRITPRLERLARATGRRILFTEAGYPSQRGAVVAPYDWTRSRVAAPDEQAAGYRALLDAVEGRSWFAGVHWWMWDDLPGSGEDQTLDYTPHDKPAEALLRERWSGAG